jgi:Tol biopolymer transport system component
VRSADDPYRHPSMAARLGRVWAALGRHRARTLGAVVAVLAVVTVAVVVGGDDQGELSTDASQETTTTEAVEATSSTTTSSTTTTTEPTTTSTTAAPTTTTPPPPPTTPPRQVFVVQSSPPGLASMHGDGSGLHLLVEGAFRNLDLAPHRSWLVMTKWAEDAEPLYTVDADGSGLTLIDDGAWQSPSVSPDGTKIAAVELQEGIGPVLVVMSRSGADQQVIQLPNGPTNNVDWSPDGRKLVVTSSSSTGLSVYDLVTRKQTLIRPGAGLTASPTWSPDGSRIAFLDGTDLVVVPAGGGPDQNLTGAFAERPREISWDGSSSLLFTAGNRMYRIGRDGSGLVPIGTGIAHPAA